MPPSGPTTTYTVRWRPSCKHLSESTAIASSSWLQVLVASWCSTITMSPCTQARLQMAINCLLVTHSPNSGVQERRDCSVAASSTCRHFLSVRPAFHLAMERSACHGITSSTPICVAVSMACSSCPVFASAWIKASLVVGCGSLPKLDTSAIPCCASRNTAWIRSPLPSESCNSSPSFRRMA